MTASPFIGSTSCGNWNSSDLTTLALAYAPVDLPTPWPILLASYIASIVVTFFGALIARSKASHPTTFTYIIETSSTIISTIRCVTALVATLRATITGSVKFDSPTALAMLSLSVLLPALPSSRSSVKAIAYVSLFNFFCAAISTGVISTLMLLTVNGVDLKHYYSKLSFVGGNCPVVVRYCPAPERFMVQGCGFASFASSEYWDIDPAVIGGDERPPEDPTENLIGARFLWYTELISGEILWWPALIVAINTAWSGWNYLRRNRKQSNEYESQDPGRGDQEPRNPETGRPRFGEENLGCLYRIWNRLRPESIFGRYCWVLFVIQVYGSIVVPVHFIAETKPRTYFVIDSVGMSTGSVYTPGDAVWSDCFNLTTPTNKLGFLKEWWQTYKEIDAILPVA